MRRVALVDFHNYLYQDKEDLQISLHRTKPVIGVRDYDYLVYLEDISCFEGSPFPVGFTLDGKPILYLDEYESVARVRLASVSDYWPMIGAPEEDHGDTTGRRFVCYPSPRPYYIVLSLKKGVGVNPDYIDWEDFSVADPVIMDENLYIKILATYSPYPDDQDTVIVWEHSPDDPGWTDRDVIAPYHIRFSPSVAGEHTITARYYAEREGCEIGYVEDTVTFTVLEKPGIDLLSEVPKDSLLIGERMPLLARLVKVNSQGQYEAMSIDSTVEWVITNVEGSGTVAKASHWRELWPGEIPSEPGHTEWWFTGTLAGASEGKVKVTPVLVYMAGYPTPQINVLTGPEHEIEVGGFVDIRFYDVGEWGQEDPGAFMAKGAIEDLTLRTCTAGDVVLSLEQREDRPLHGLRL